MARALLASVDMGGMAYSFKFTTGRVRITRRVREREESDDIEKAGEEERKMGEKRVKHSILINSAASLLALHKLT
jgi:hypothetical protein